MKSRISLVVISVFIIALALIGCGGGGGGSNPVASQAPAALANLSGSVMMEGVPLSNAKVYLYKPYAARNAGIAKLASIRGSLLAQTANSDGSYSEISDANGRYSFTGIPVGEYTLIVEKDVNHRFTRTNIMLGSVTTVDAQLTPTGSISGHIILTSGSVSSNVSGAMVYLDGTSYVALTDVNGNFTISHVPASQTFALNVMSSKGNLVSPIPVNLTPAEIKSLGNIILSPYSTNVVTLSGSMQRAVPTDTYTIEGLMVALLDNQTRSLSFTIADEFGNYGFIITASGSYTVRPMDDEDMTYTPEHQTVSVDLSSSVTVPAFSLTPIQHQVVNMRDVIGVLTKNPRLPDEADNSGVTVVMSPTGTTTGTPMTTVTDTSGQFSFRVKDGDYNLAIGGRYAFETAFTNPISVATFTNLGSFNIKPAVSTVPIHSVTGALVKNPRLTDEADGSGVQVIMTRTYPTAGLPVQTFTDPLGRFNFNVEQGSYSVAIGGRYKFETAFTNPIDVTGTTPLGTINIAPSVDIVSKHMLTIQVNKVNMISGDSNNAGVLVSIALDGGSSDMRSTVTNSLGIARFEVASGAYDLEISGDYIPVNALTNPISVTADTTQTIDVKPKNPNPGSVEWTLAGIPTNVSYRVYLTNDITSEVQYKGTNLGNNKVIFNNVYPSSYTLSLKSVDNGYSATSGQFDVSNGETVVRPSITPTLQAPTITTATYTTNLFVNGAGFVAGQNVYVDGTKLPLISQSAVQLEVKAVDVRPGTYTLSLENPDGTVSANTVEFFKPLAKPTIVNSSIKVTDTGITINWELADFADKSKVALLNSGSNVITPVDTQETAYSYNSLASNTVYTIRVTNGFGTIESGYAEHTFTTKNSGADATALPKVLLANSSFIDGPTGNLPVDAIGFEVVDNTYYVGWINRSTGIVGINSYNFDGSEKDTVSRASSNSSISQFDMTADNSAIYLFAPNNGGDGMQIEKYDLGLNLTVGPVDCDGNGSIPLMQRAKIKVFDGKVVLSGSAGTSLNVVVMDTNLANPSTIYSDSSYYSPLSEVKGFYALAVADVANNKLFVAIATGSFALDEVNVYEYDLTTLTQNSVPLIYVPSKGEIRQFKALDSYFVVGVVSGSSQQHYKIDRVNGYSSRGSAEYRTSAEADAQGRVWYADRPGGSKGTAYFVRTSDGFNQDRAININNFVNYDMSSGLCIPGESIKLQQSDKSMCFLYRDSGGSLAVLRYDSSY